MRIVRFTFSRSSVILTDSENDLAEGIRMRREITYGEISACERRY